MVFLIASFGIVGKVEKNMDSLVANLIVKLTLIVYISAQTMIQAKRSIKAR